MQTPTNSNDQHAWGGQRYQPVSPHSPAAISEQDHPTVIAHEQQNAPTQPLSQGGFIASSSDNLFHPVRDLCSSYVFSLPDVPSNPRLNAYNHQPLSYHSPFSSYNNPMFTILHHAHYNHARTSPITAPLGPPPPIPSRPQPVHQFSQPQPFPYMYNHSYPVLNLHFLYYNINKIFTTLFHLYIRILLYIRTLLYVFLHLCLLLFLLQKLHLLSHTSLFFIRSMNSSPGRLLTLSSMQMVSLVTSWTPPLMWIQLNRISHLVLLPSWQYHPQLGRLKPLIIGGLKIMLPNTYFFLDLDLFPMALFLPLTL